MTFGHTYHEEVLQSRRDRSRRALFWARVLGFVLMIAFAASLRADPKLRGLLMEAGMDGVVRVVSVLNPNAEMAMAQRASEARADPQSPLPASRIKVNRPESRVPADAQTIAQGLGDGLAAQTPGQ